MQKNWIGKSVGCEIDFKTNIDKEIKIFTTRPDTIFEQHFLQYLDHPIYKNLKDDKSFLKFKDECSKIGTTESPSQTQTSLVIRHLFKPIIHF